MGSIRRDQLPTAIVLALGAVVLVAMAIIDGNPIMYVTLILFAAMIWWNWPGRVGRHTAHADAHATAAEDDIIVYWRPG